MKLSVVAKRVTILLMTMALAVAMVACQAATPKPGEKGDPGTPGEQGPKGDPGTTNNEPPMPSKALSMVYLALAGTGKMEKAGPIDLSKHFTDKENAALTYKADSSDKTKATAAVDNSGMLTVTGTGAGSAKITVEAYDGVNTDPAISTFDVMVVASNAIPTVGKTTGVTGEVDAPLGAPGGDPAAASPTVATKLGVKLYDQDEPLTIPLTGLTIDPGTATNFEDGIDYDVAMGKSGDADNIVKVLLAKGKKGVWEITLTPIQPGRQTVVVTLKDKFGAKADSDDDPDGDGTPADDDKLTFVAFVNTPPEHTAKMPDKTLVATGGAAADGFIYTVKKYFETAEKAPTAGGDSGTAEPGALTAQFQSAACSIHTSRTDANANTLTGTTIGTVVTEATATATTVGPPSIAIDPNNVVAAGSFYVTITCMDRDATVSDTAKVTIRK
jgi:hypothetical protein